MLPRLTGGLARAFLQLPLRAFSSVASVRYPNALCPARDVSQAVEFKARDASPVNCGKLQPVTDPAITKHLQ